MQLTCLVGPTLLIGPEKRKDVFGKRNVVESNLFHNFYFFISVINIFYTALYTVYNLMNV